MKAFGADPLARDNRGGRDWPLLTADCRKTLRFHDNQQEPVYASRELLAIIGSIHIHERLRDGELLL